MAKQFENTLERFARPAPGIIYYAVVFIAICLLITASVISAFSLNFTIAAISILAAGSVIVLAVLAIRYQRSLVGEKAGGWISWESALPELQRQNLNIAVDELSRILKVEADAAGDLQSVFIVAGDLALRQIQQEENVPVMRHVSVSGIPFDAVFTKRDILVCCEVSFLLSPELGQERVVAMMHKIAAVKSAVAEMNIGLAVRLMVVLVTQLNETELETLRDTLSTKRFSSTSVDIDIRLLDFAELQRTYVTD